MMNKPARILDGLRAVGPFRQEISDLLAELDGAGEPLAPAAVVCLVGPTGAGKSTLLNALAGTDVATPGVNRPTTSTPVVYAPSDLPDESVARLPKADIVRYEPSPSRPWSGHVLIDAPDMNSVREDHRDTVRRLAAEADVLLVVLHHQSVVENETVEFLEDYSNRRQIAVVLNRVDEMTDAVREAVWNQCKTLAEEHWQVDPELVFALSARNAGDAPGSEPDFQRLVSWLARLIDRRIVQGLRRDNLEGTRNRIASIYGEVAKDVLPGLTRLMGNIEGGWETIAKGVAADARERIEARRADLETALGASVAQQWRGPGGWMLRAGVWGPMGAMAAFTVRRNLLAAGAIAAGGQLVDKVQELRRDSRLSHERLGPAPARLQRLTDGAMRQARMEAAELGSNEAFERSWSTSDGVEAMVERLEESWEHVLEVDVPRAASGGGMRTFRFLADLPLYALGAHVGWQSAVGYFSGAYLGTNYYVNAAALGFLAAGVVYLLARAGIAVATRRLTANAATAVLQAAGEEAAARLAPARAATDEIRSALRALARTS